MTLEHKDSSTSNASKTLKVEIVESGWAKAKPFIEGITVIALLIGLFFTFLEYRTAGRKADEAEAALQQATNALKIAQDSKSDARSALAVASNAEVKILGAVNAMGTAQTQVSNLLFTVHNRQKELFKLSDTNRLLIAEKDDGAVNVVFSLSKVPIAGSVDIELRGASDFPGAGFLLHNVYVSAYNGDFDSIAKESFVVIYYPDLDQSVSLLSVAHTTNQIYTYDEKANQQVFFPALYKRFAAPETK